MEPSQGPVERRAHGARMPTDPLPAGPLLKRGRENKREQESREQEEENVPNQKVVVSLCYM